MPGTNIFMIVLYIAGVVLLLDTIMIGVLLKMVMKQNKLINQSDIITHHSVKNSKTTKDNVIKQNKSCGNVTERHESRRGFWYELTKDPNTLELLMYRDSNNHVIDMRQYKVA